jgi:hypothetical protein
LAEGVLDASAAVDGEVVVHDLSRRNLNMLVSQGPAAVFVKRGSGMERTWYRRIAGVPALADLVPPVRETGEESDLLLIETETGTTDLWDYHLEREAFPVALGRDVGRALGLLHHGAPRSMAEGDRARPPTALSIHRPPVEALRELTPATLRLVRMLQRHRTAGEVLDHFRGSWNDAAVIHNDVKWPNILAVPRPGGVLPGIRLVDWEQAGVGDPAWDLGSALAAYLTFWISSISPRPGAHGAADLADSARFPLEAMRPAIRACWAEYGATSGLGNSDEFLVRVAGFAATRLLQTAYEATEATMVVSPAASLHLQVAVNVLDDPARAAAQLLGLGGAATGPATP